MTEKKKILTYWLLVGIFDIVSLVCAIFSIIKFLFLDNFLTGLSFFFSRSLGACCNVVNFSYRETF